ncbi:ankyrin repeat domain-containing protein [Candidatus Babela massiliensis]|uniref:Ankyrin repeats containing protein n=1 Tax=Candidatus Babela massiliensis TaxID=673862 RepID=V6DHH7_9BACT|nr:ankyrin repeat domain-containing protein [Candidatus Babela massiliensis]CDK30418.1 Ankyrin repeats containing protein [Candidatus Babela massiliensis]
MGQKEIVEILIRANANIDIRDVTGKTALIIAAMKKNNAHIIDALIKAGANTNCRDNSGRDYLYYKGLYQQNYQQEKMLRLITIEVPAILTRLFILWVLNKDPKKEEKNTDKSDKQENEDIEIKDIVSSNEQTNESVLFP